MLGHGAGRALSRDKRDKRGSSHKVVSFWLCIGILRYILSIKLGSPTPPALEVTAVYVVMVTESRSLAGFGNYYG